MTNFEYYKSEEDANTDYAWFVNGINWHRMISLAGGHGDIEIPSFFDWLKMEHRGSDKKNNSEEKDTRKSRNYKFCYMVFENKEHTLSYNKYFECWADDFTKAMDKFVDWMHNRYAFGYSYEIAWEDGIEIFNREEQEKKAYLALKMKYKGDDDVNRYAELKRKYGYLDKENN